MKCILHRIPISFHANIIKYCNRPFYKDGDFVGTGDIDARPWASDEIKKARCEWMNEELIKRWNETVTEDDIVYHLGDFGYGTREQVKELKRRLNGEIILIQGNHDYKSRNGYKSCINQCILEFGGNLVFASHHPPVLVPIECDFAIFGHIHDKAKHIIVDGKVSINVSVEMWDYRPVSMKSLLKYYKLVRNGSVDTYGNKKIGIV